MAVHIDDHIEQVYQAFSTKWVPTSIEACPCCLDRDDIGALLATPLRRLTPAQLYSYVSTVFYTVGSVADFRYFLPRILELACREPDNMPDLEIALRKFDLAGWMQWDAQEVAVLGALFEAAFEQAPLSTDPGWTVDTWICGLALAGFDVVPLLHKLEDPSQEDALIGYYEQNSEQLWKNKLGNAFWKDSETKAQPVIDWFQSATVQALIQKHYGAI